MALAYVTTNSVTQGNRSDIEMSLSGFSSGDEMIFISNWEATGLTFTLPTGWETVEQREEATGGEDVTLMTIRKRHDGSEPATVTLQSGGFSGCSGFVSGYSGATDQTPPFSADNGTDASIEYGALTISGNSAEVVSACNWNWNSMAGYSGLTSRYSVIGQSGWTDDTAVSSSQSETMSSATNWCSIRVELEEDGGGGGVTPIPSIKQGSQPYQPIAAHTMGGYKQ